MTHNRIFVFLTLAASAAVGGKAQAPAAPPRFVGTVQAVRAAEVDVKPDQGDARTAKIILESVFQRVAPGEKDLKSARPIAFKDVAVGDRVLVALEPGTGDLRRLVVMSASDIAKRNEADRQDWQKRGISGVVSANNGTEIALRMRSAMGEKSAVVTVTEKTTYRRYAPDSVRFADARASGIREIQVGDQVKARGEKSEDGAKVTAEDVVFGTFLTKAGKISAINLEAREVTAAELGTDKPLTIKLTADSAIKAMPNFGAMMGGGGGMPGGAPGGMPAGMKAPDLSEMLERIPAGKIEDLAVGQTVVVSSTKGATAGTVTAITLLANAEMFIQMARMQSGGGSPGGLGGGMGAAGLGGGMGGGMDGIQLPGMVP